MYLVASKWGVDPAKAEAFKATGKKMREYMRSVPGIESVQAIQCEDGNMFVVVGYTNESSYKKIMEPGGAFETAAKQNDLENLGTWMWSERGEVIDHDMAMA